MAIDPKKLKEQAQAVATMKMEATAPMSTKVEAAPVAASEPPKPPPLPRVPRSPRRPAVAVREAAAAPLQPPAPPARGRELPADPVAREAALAEIRPTAETILAICDVVAARLPPGRPLSVDERNAIGKPLELTLYKYGGDLAPEWQLTLAVGMVAFGRYVEVKAARLGAPSETEKKPEAPPKAA